MKCEGRYQAAANPKHQEGWAAAGPRLCYAKYMCRHWKAGTKPWPQTRKPRDEFCFPTSCNMLLDTKSLAVIGTEASQCSAYCPLSWFILLEVCFIFVAGPTWDVSTVFGIWGFIGGIFGQAPAFEVLKEPWRLLGGSVVQGFKAWVTAEICVLRAVDGYKHTRSFWVLSGIEVQLNWPLD